MVLDRLKFIAALLITFNLINAEVLAETAAYNAQVIVSDFEKPWSIAELPDSELLLTEQGGRLWRVDGMGNKFEISGVPVVYNKSQGGLFDVLPATDFAESGALYIAYAGGGTAANRTTVVKTHLINNTLTETTTLLEVNPDKDTAAHYGGKLAWLADGTLLVSVGDGFEYREQAQDLNSEMGKLLRINADGTIPANNPFADTAPRVFSYGHRNPQGLVVDAATGNIFMTEHGPKGGDELNIITPGKNYGWPAITYGVDYSGALISPFTENPGMEQPITYWVPSIATSGLAIYHGSEFAAWDGDLLIGALVDRKLYRLEMDGSTVLSQSEPFPDVQGRVRDVRVFSNGVIYAVTDEGQLYRITRE